jgi:hypothetical protein
VGRGLLLVVLGVVATKLLMELRWEGCRRRGMRVDGEVGVLGVEGIGGVDRREVWKI